MALSPVEKVRLQALNDHFSYMGKKPVVCTHDIWAPFACDVLADPRIGVASHASPEARAGYEEVAALYRRLLDGDAPRRQEWDEASMRAADSRAYAASHAAYVMWQSMLPPSEKLIPEKLALSVKEFMEGAAELIRADLAVKGQVQRFRGKEPKNTLDERARRYELAWHGRLVQLAAPARPLSAVGALDF